MKYMDKTWYVIHSVDKIVMGRFNDEESAWRVAEQYLNVEVLSPHESTEYPKGFKGR